MMQGRRTQDKLVIFGSLIGLIVLVVACFFIFNLLSNISSAFIPLVAGILLLIANRGGLVELLQTRQVSPTVVNPLIGLALVLAGLGTTIFGGTAFRFLFYAPGLALLFLALPMALSRPSMYNSYRRWGGTVMGTFRRVTGRGAPTTVNHIPGQSQPTVNLDPTAYQQTPYDPTQRR